MHIVFLIMAAHSNGQGYHIANVKSWSCVHMHFRFLTFTR